MELMKIKRQLASHGSNLKKVAIKTVVSMCCACVCA